jgi:hypothetical protein
MFLLMIGFASAYAVNVPLTVQLTVQHDNGVTLTPVVTQACIGSVYSYSTFQLIVRDQPLIAGNPYHSFTFTPTSIGDYSISVKCDYLNESATYFETISVTAPVSGSGSSSSGQTLILNALIQPDKDLYIVNTQQDSQLTIQVKYFIDNSLANAKESYYTILKGDKSIKQGNFQVLSAGIYQLDTDLSDYVVGDDYKVVLYFDGRSKIVSLNVISMSSDLSFITAKLIDPNTGQISQTREIIAIVLLLCLIIIVWFIVRKMFGRKKKKK